MTDRTHGPFKVGDVVVVVKSIRGFEGSEGTVMEIRDPERPVVEPQKNTFVLLNGKHSGTKSGCWRYEPSHLRLKKPPSDQYIRQETTDWSKCAWQPQRTEA